MTDNMKFSRSMVATTVFIASLVLVYCIHISFFRVNVIFYAAIADAFVASAIAGVILLAWSYFRILGHFEKVQLIAIWLLIGYALAISVPTVIDRSLSFYILEKLKQRGGGIKQEKFEQVFTKEYVKEYRLVDVRLTEQLESGTIKIEEGCVKLTERGQRIAGIGQYFRRHWLPKNRLLMGRYSDVLTNPFQNDTRQMDYLCK